MKKLIFLAVCLAGLPSTFEPAFGANAPADAEKKRQDSLRAVRLEKVSAFRAAYPNVTIQTNPVTGAPEDIWGDISKNQTQSEVVEAAYEFFEQNKTLYGMSTPREELKLQRKSIDQYGGMVDFKQLYKGVEVYQSSLRAYYTPSGKLKGIMGGFARVPEITTSSSLDSTTAIAIAKRDLGYTIDDEKKAKEFLALLRKKRNPLNAWLLVAPFENQYRLVWIVGLYRERPESPENWEYWIDAMTGSILQKKETMIGSGRKMQTPDTGAPPATKPNKPPSDTGNKSGIPEHESQTSPQVIQLYPENYTPATVEQMDSIRAARKFDPKDAARSTHSEERWMEIQSRGPWRPGPEEHLIPGKRVFRLQKPIDSMIKDSGPNPKPPEKKNDSLQGNANKSGSVFVNVTMEGFEGSFPANSPNWYPFDNDSTVNGEYYWGKDDFNLRQFTCCYSAWCARAGLNGLDPEFNNYANNMRSWLMYGPFSLTDASAAHLFFWYWLKTEYIPSPLKYDGFFWTYSTDGFNFYGIGGIAGNTGGWQFLDLSLDTVGGNLLGRTNLWIALIFESDGSTTDKGVFLDDISLDKDVPSGGSPNLNGYYTPLGWDGPIVVSCCPGTNKHSQPRVNQPAYIDWAVRNDGTRATSTRTVSVLVVDDVP